MVGSRDLPIRAQCTYEGPHTPNFNPHKEHATYLLPLYAYIYRVHIGYTTARSSVGHQCNK